MTDGDQKQFCCIVLSGLIHYRSKKYRIRRTRSKQSSGQREWWAHDKFQEATQKALIPNPENVYEDIYSHMKEKII
jgi:hypothetical protein